VALERDRVHGHRIRPARRPRWRRYAPGLTTTVLAALLIVAVGPVADLGARLTIGAQLSATFAGALVVGLAALSAALCEGSPARWCIAGAFALGLGGNLAPPRGVGIPLLALGLVGIAVQEVRRAFDGITLGPQGLTMHRPLKDPLTVDFPDIEAIHTTPTIAGAGTLILETEHGTVTARDLPDVEQLQARIEARAGGFEIDDPTDAARRARKQIQGLLDGEAPT